MDLVKNWFSNGCDYASGVIIYSNLPKHNSLLLKQFQKKNNTFNLEKLKYELKKFEAKYSENEIVTILKAEITQIVNSVPAQIDEQVKKNAVLFHQLPESLRPVLLEANNLFKENCMLKVTLNELPEHAEKQSISIQLKIYENIKKNALCWSRIDFYIEKRIITESPKSEFEQLTGARLSKRQQYLFSSISKLKSRLKINKELLKSAESVSQRSKIERAIVKQEENLLNQNEKLLEISKLIDGK
ncbi:hypothetical protein [Flavobacterium panacagri]|uniref:hypothetical protein n=1 Tax=Flavobacterium panacagri TaxID=3034146 RepID=UPI0025A56424|nr:hypothetical protein [Flavobacterium panacagri]